MADKETLENFCSSLENFISSSKEIYSKVEKLPNKKWFTLVELEEVLKNFSWCRVEHILDDIVFCGYYPEGQGSIYFYAYSRVVKNGDKYSFSKSGILHQIEHCISVYEQQLKNAKNLIDNYESAVECKTKYDKFSYQYGELFNLFVKE